MQLELSVIIPVYNGSEYIVKCIDSLLCQKNVLLEIIVINDKSIDNTTDVLAIYKDDFRVKCIEQGENRGQGYCRNIGLSLAKGDYILFIDADDYIVANQLILSACIKEILSKDLDILDCPYRVIDKQNKELKNKIDIEEVVSGEKYLNSVSVLSVVVWNKLFKRSFLQNRGLVFKDRKYEDVTFNIECFLVANRVSSSNLVFYNYIIQENSTMTSTPNEKNVLDAVELVLDLEKIYILNKDIYQVEKSFLYSFIGANRIMSNYKGDLNKIKECEIKYNTMFKKYRKEILTTKTLNIVLRLSLFFSPSLANKILLLLNR